MNYSIIMGRLTADPELRYTPSNKAFTRITVAVNRSFKNENGEVDADFISVVAWEKTAETIAKYFKKGNRIGVEGRIQTGSYEKEDGSRGYLTDVIANRIHFIELKEKEERPAPEYTSESNSSEDPFADFGDSIEILDNDLPF